MSSDFHFLVPESFQKNLVQISTVVSEKIPLEFLYVHDPGPRSRNDLDLQYSHTLIYSITMSGNTLRVSYHLCIRHSLGTVFKLYQSSENTHRYFHITKTKNMYRPSYAA